MKRELKKQLGLVGNPLSHTLSPFIHKSLLSLRSLSADYGLFEADLSALPALFESTLIKLDGFNVTAPHKVNIIPLLGGLSKRAEMFGAVNTVAAENGKAVGYNTDSIGFLRSLEYAGIELGGRVLILGAGGAARMFAFESALADAEVTLAVRTTGLEKAKKLKDEMENRLSKRAGILTLDSVNEGYDLIINATPVGMYPDTETSPLAPETVCKSAAVFDAVYNPGETLLLKYAREGGLKCVNGLPMLVWQAAAAEEIWNGISFEKSEVERVTKLTKEELEKR